MEVQILGIRHHGPGSARSLGDALEALSPDVILVEGPPDAESLLPLSAHEDMRPPVALLTYRPDMPHRAVYYPFAEFSPEWNAIRFGLSRAIPVRFMDLPQSHRFALEAEELQADSPKSAAPEEGGGHLNVDFEEAEELLERIPDSPRPEDEEAGLEAEYAQADPFKWIAEAAGYSDSERWWEEMVEQRRDSRDVFAAILELMTALRAEAEKSDGRLPGEKQNRTREEFVKGMELRREAWMRQTLRAAIKEGFERIAVVCGAWHGPALVDMGPAKQDAELLKGMPKVKTAATWIPWTYDRLTWWSGYGAGIDSPGYYETLWEHPDHAAVRWMGRIANLLREEDLESSPASSIEAVRLADTLAALRQRRLPGLDDLMEAAQATLCFGSETPVRLIQRRLIVGERLGSVPAEAPTIPLQQDLEREQRRLRLQPEAAERALDLDLRKPNDMDRSRMLHRLNLLDVPWGTPEDQGSSGFSPGIGGGGANRGASRAISTFHELWRLRWEPELAVNVIDAGIWGNSILDAATNRARNVADSTGDLASLTAMVGQVLLADLPDAMAPLLHRLDNLAGITSDVPVLMDAIPPLANAARYGNVRGLNVDVVDAAIDGLVLRVCIGLPAASSALNDEAAEQMFGRMMRMNHALGILQKDELLEPWREALGRLADQNGLHGLVGGRSCRILLDSTVLSAEEAARKMNRALSRANPAPQAAAWVDGFLRGSGLMLLHQEEVLAILDEWVSGARDEDFLEMLPVVRRTFATFAPPERRQIGERIKSGRRESRSVEDADEIDPVRAARVLPTVAKLLGLEYPAEAAS